MRIHIALFDQIPQTVLSEGVETTNFIKALGWNKGVVQGPSAEYNEDSHIIHAHSSDSDGLVFMPFGLAAIGSGH